MRGRGAGVCSATARRFHLDFGRHDQRRRRQALEDAADLYRAIFESRDVIKILGIDPESGRGRQSGRRRIMAFPARTCGNARSGNSAPPAVAGAVDWINTGRADSRQHRRANGKLCEVGLHLDLIHRRTFLLATVLDLTERKRVEAATRTSLAFQKEWTPFPARFL